MSCLLPTVVSTSDHLIKVVRCPKSGLVGVFTRCFTSHNWKVKSWNCTTNVQIDKWGNKTLTLHFTNFDQTQSDYPLKPTRIPKSCSHTSYRSWYLHISLYDISLIMIICKSQIHRCDNIMIIWDSHLKMFKLFTKTTIIFDSNAHVICECLKNCFM